MKKTTTGLVGLMLLLALTGCAAETVEDVRRDAEFVKVCEDNKGRVMYNMLNQMYCFFDTH
jgi:hypothetical protein